MRLSNLFAALLLLALAAAQADGHQFEVEVHLGEIDQLPLNGLLKLRVKGRDQECEDFFIVNETPESAQELLPNRTYSTAVELNCSAPSIETTQFYWTERTSARAVAGRAWHLLPIGAPKSITVKQIDFDPVYLSTAQSRAEQRVQFVAGAGQTGVRLEHKQVHTFCQTKRRLVEALVRQRTLPNPHGLNFYAYSRADPPESSRN